MAQVLKSRKGKAKLAKGRNRKASGRKNCVSKKKNLFGFLTKKKVTYHRDVKGERTALRKQHLADLKYEADRKKLEAQVAQASRAQDKAADTIQAAAKKEKSGSISESKFAEIKGRMEREIEKQQKFKAAHQNPAVSGPQYRLAQAVLHGKARSSMPRKVAKEIVDRTPAKLRSAFMAGAGNNPAGEYSVFIGGVGWKYGFQTLTQARDYVAAHPGRRFDIHKGAKTVETGKAGRNPTDAYNAGRAGLKAGAAKHGTVNLSPSTVQREDWGHAWRDFMRGWNDEKRANNPGYQEKYLIEPSGETAIKLSVAKQKAKALAARVGHAEVRDFRGKPLFRYTKKANGQNPRYLGAIIRKKKGYGHEMIFTVYLPEDKGQVSYRTGSLAEAKEWVKRNKGVLGHGRNPLEAAAKLSEAFHGRPAREVETIREKLRSHGVLTKLGELVRIVIDTPTGFVATLPFNTNDSKKIVRLASSEDGKQLYFRGGDQEINLEKLGMNTPRWLRDKIELGRLHEFPKDVEEGSIVYRAKKHFNNFRSTDWWHKAGEESSRSVGPGARPILVYDFRNKLLELVGGNYAVKAPGIIN